MKKIILVSLGNRFPNDFMGKLYVGLEDEKTFSLDIINMQNADEIKRELLLLSKDKSNFVDAKKKIIVFNFLSEMHKKGRPEVLIKLIHCLQRKKKFSGNLASYSLDEISKQPILFPADHFIRKPDNLLDCISEKCNCNQLKKIRENKNVKNIR